MHVYIHSCARIDNARIYACASVYMDIHMQHPLQSVWPSNDHGSGRSQRHCQACKHPVHSSILTITSSPRFPPPTPPPWRSHTNGVFGNWEPSSSCHTSRNAECATCCVSEVRLRRVEWCLCSVPTHTHTHTHTCTSTRAQIQTFKYRYTHKYINIQTHRTATSENLIHALLGMTCTSGTHLALLPSTS